MQAAQYRRSCSTHICATVPRAATAAATRSLLTAHIRDDFLITFVNAVMTNAAHAH